MTKINFCFLPFLSIDYSNVIDFENESKRESYFKSITKLSKDGNIKYDGERTIININLSVEKLKEYDYLFFKDSNGNTFYYFITNIEMVTKSNSNIYLKLDVWTTYLFDYELFPSFVDRCHVNRWEGDTPTLNIEEEGLFYGDVVQIEKSKLSSLGKGIILTTSAPIGKVENPTATDDGTSSIGTGTGDFNAGRVSSDLLRTIKGWEGLNKYNTDVGDGEDTVGYGITRIGEPDLWSELHNAEPVKEKHGAEILYQSLNQNYASVVKPYIQEIGITKQCQFDALVDFCYNAGSGRFVKHLDTWKQAIQCSSLAEVEELFIDLYATMNGVAHSGLRDRRKKMASMFFEGKYYKKPIYMYGIKNSYIGEFNGDGWLPS